MPARELAEKDKEVMMEAKSVKSMRKKSLNRMDVAEGMMGE